MDFYILAQQLINGITLGTIYGLIAVGYTMVYGVIRMINFAHGDVYMVSAYVAAIVLAVISFFGIQSVPFALISILVITCRHGGLRLGDRARCIPAFARFDQTCAADLGHRHFADAAKLCSDRPGRT
jgi:hypothetical protein